MTGISSGVPPIKFDSAGNVLANINAQNIYPITGGSNLIVVNSITLTSNVGFSTIYIESGQILTIPSGVTVIIDGQITGSGQLVVNGNLIVAGNVSVTGSISISGSGNINILSGNTLSISANVQISGVSIIGAGTLSVASGYTLTQTGAISISVSNVQVAGTWANAGYGITIPSGATVTWSTTGSITTTSPAGTLTVNGILYYYGAGLTTQSSNAVPRFILSLSGSGLFIASPTSTNGDATNTITLSATAIAPNSADGSVAGTGKIPYFYLTQISGSAVGLYGLGILDTINKIYTIFCLIYIGTASSTYNVACYANNNAIDDTNTTAIVNANGSAGTITLTGTAYV